MVTAGSIKRDLQRMSAAAARRDRRDAALDAAVREAGDQLLDLLVGAGVASGATVEANGTSYRFEVVNEALSDTPAVRRSHAVLLADDAPLIPGPGGAEAARRFWDDRGAIAEGFALQATQELSAELFPKSSFLGRLEVACSRIADRFTHTPGGRLADDVVGDLTGAATGGIQPRMSETRPVRIAARLLARVAGQILREDKTPALLLAGGGIAAAAGVTPAVIAAALGAAVAREGIGYLRAAGERLRLTQAARSQMSYTQRRDAAASLVQLSSSWRVKRALEARTPAHDGRAAQPSAALA